MNDPAEHNIIVYATKRCPYCIKAFDLLKKREAPSVEKIYIDDDPDAFKQMLSLSFPLRSVPQIFIGGKHIGGFDALEELDKADELIPLLDQVKAANGI